MNDAAHASGIAGAVMLHRSDAQRQLWSHSVIEAPILFQKQREREKTSESCIIELAKKIT